MFPCLLSFFFVVFCYWNKCGTLTSAVYIILKKNRPTDPSDFFHERANKNNNKLALCSFWNIYFNFFKAFIVISNIMIKSTRFSTVKHIKGFPPPQRHWSISVHDSFNVCIIALKWLQYISEFRIICLFIFHSLTTMLDCHY